MGRQDWETETFIPVTGGGFDDVSGTLGANHGNIKAEHAWTGQLIPFDTTQVTSPMHRAKNEPGEPFHTLAKGQHPPAIAYQCQGTNVGEMGTLRSGNGDVTGGVPFVTGAITARFGGQAMGAPEVDAGMYIPGADTKPHVATKYGVRRLTPRECERLQGFPDDWTAVHNRGKPATDGPRYQALGNSMAVPVVAWIGRRIVEAASRAE